MPLRHTIASSALATQHSLKWLDGVSDALAYALRRLRDRWPLRHSGHTPAPTPPADYPPHASHFPGGQRRPRSRVSMNLMLSMPAGTDKKAFELAVGDVLNREYANFDYLYAFHDDRDHYHAHVVVGLCGQDGRWLNPRKGDIVQWRQSFALSLQGRGIAAKATPSYSQGKRKSGYRRDLAELGKRGTRRVVRPAPTYDQAKEDAAIAERRQAWTRIGAHYGEAGDAELAQGIAAYVADHFAGAKVR